MYGDVEVQIGDSAFTLRYGNAVWDSLKQRFGVATEVDCVARAKGPGDQAVFFRAGLSVYQPEMTAADVVALAENGALATAVWAAVILALPEPKKKPEKKAPQKKAPESPGPHDLRREAFKAGMTPTEFGIVTPREAVMFIEAAAWRNTEMARLALINAWHSGAWSATAAAGKLRPLAEVLSRAFQGEGGPASSAAARVAAAKGYAERHNARVKKQEAVSGG